MSKLLKIMLFGIATLLASQTTAQEVWREGEFRGLVVLTVTGNVGLPTRSASSKDVDMFFDFNGITFENAAQFDYASLQAFPQKKIRADFPKGSQVSTYEGPMLADVLASVAALGEIITIRALDGHVVTIPLTEAYALGAVLALKRDGIPFAIGDFGPAHLVFPRAERTDLANMSDDWWVWAIYHINVE